MLLEGPVRLFLLNLILAKIRSKQHIALAVASSGIAATLISSGKTAHSTFKLPLDLTNDDETQCNVSKNSPTGLLLNQCRLIVWDECTMSHKGGIQAVNNLMKDIKNNSHIMGGIPILFSGDFRQILPVIPNGTKADELNACIKYSYLWSNIKQLSLSINMRLINKDKNYENSFDKKILKIGNGEYSLDNKNVYN